MDLLLLLKFTHVFAAVVWIGSGLGLVIAGAAIGSRGPADRLVAILQLVVLLAPRVLVPSSLVVLASGLTLAILGGYGWPAWLVLGLTGIAATIALGAGLIGPACEKAVLRAERAGPEAAREDILRVFRLARFDYVLHAAIVFLMVVKPAWEEVGVLFAVALFLVAGAALFLPRTTVRMA